MTPRNLLNTSALETDEIPAAGSNTTYSEPPMIQHYFPNGEPIDEHAANGVLVDPETPPAAAAMITWLLVERAALIGIYNQLSDWYDQVFQEREAIQRNLDVLVGMVADDLARRQASFKSWQPPAGNGQPE